MKTLKKINIVSILIVFTILIGACKKDCTLANSCINKIKALDRQIRHNYDVVRTSDYVPCDELNKQLDQLYKECKETKAIDNTDYEYLKDLITEKCNIPV